MNSSATRCPVCNSKDFYCSDVSHTFIGHKDFLPLKRAPSRLFQCDRCRTIFISEHDQFSEIEDIYHGEAYAKEKKTEHVVFEQKGTAAPSLRTTYSTFAELIGPRVKKAGRSDPLKFLDIGCFDGKLLLELKKDFPDAVMDGFDVSDYVGEIFPKERDFTFYTGTLENVRATYDAIMVVNVLAYIDDLRGFAAHIDRLLAPDGLVFFSCADARKNPYFLTCGDQYTYQTPASLRNFWGHFGYAVEYVDTEISFPRSIVGFSWRDATCSAAPFESDDTLQASLSYLSRATTELRQAIASHRARHPSGHIAILGCTNNAAWAHNQIGSEIACFADENPSRVGRTFYGKPVVPPDQLASDDLLLLPYGETAHALAEKFGKLYRAEVCVL